MDGAYWGGFRTNKTQPPNSIFSLLRREEKPARVFEGLVFLFVPCNGHWRRTTDFALQEDPESVGGLRPPPPPPRLSFRSISYSTVSLSLFRVNSTDGLIGWRSAQPSDRRKEKLLQLKKHYNVWCCFGGGRPSIATSPRAIDQTKGQLARKTFPFFYPSLSSFGR